MEFKQKPNIYIYTHLFIYLFIYGWEHRLKSQSIHKESERKRLKKHLYFQRIMNSVPTTTATATIIRTIRVNGIFIVQMIPIRDIPRLSNCFCVT